MLKKREKKENLLGVTTYFIARNKTGAISAPVQDRNISIVVGWYSVMLLVLLVHHHHVPHLAAYCQYQLGRMPTEACGPEVPFQMRIRDMLSLQAE